MAFNTNVYLGNVDFGINDMHRYNDIDSAFISVLAIENARMIKDNLIRVNAPFDVTNRLGYGYYTPNGSQKRFYFFIIGTNYINDNCVEIAISIDWFSTDFRKIEFKNSFVQRIHPLNFSDKFPNISEPLLFGEEKFTFESRQDITYNNTYIIGVTHDIPTTLIADIDYVIKNVKSNIFYTVHTAKELSGRVDGVVYYVLDSIDKCMNVYQNAINFGYSSSITGIWSVPDFIKQNTTDYTLVLNTFIDVAVETVKVLNSSNGLVPAFQSAVSTQKPTTIDGYTPKYSKCFSNEYIKPCIQIGDQICVYNYELFGDENNIIFNCLCTNTPNVTLYVVPYNYNGANNYSNFNNAISIDLSISGSLTSDNSSREINNLISNSLFSALHNLVGFGSNIINNNVQSNFNKLKTDGGVQETFEDFYNSEVSKNENLVMNALQLGKNAINGGLNIVQSAREIGKSASTILTSGSASPISMLPDTERAIHVGYVSYRYDDIKRLDQYFSYYGYEIDSFITPYLRDTYTFIRGDINFTGDISSVSRNYIKNLFANGLTIWNSQSIYKYDVE